MFNLFGNALNAISRQNSVVSSFARDYNEEGINLIDQKNEMHAQLIGPHGRVQFDC